MNKKKVEFITRAMCIVLFISTGIMGYLYYQKTQNDKKESEIRTALEHDLSDIKKRLEDHIKKDHPATE